MLRADNGELYPLELHHVFSLVTYTAKRSFLEAVDCSLDHI